jgi:hypothetical protein
MGAVQRDVYNPLLFEIAWEVANKGNNKRERKNTHTRGDTYADLSLIYSGWYLHGHQDQSPSDDTRVW